MSEMEKLYLRQVYKWAKVPAPIKSKVLHFIICGECGQGFSSRDIESYIKHHKREHQHQKVK